MARRAHAVRRPPPSDIDRLPMRDVDLHAVSASVTHDIILPFLLACVFVGLVLAVSAWAMRGFSVTL